MLVACNLEQTLETVRLLTQVPVLLGELQMPVGAVLTLTQFLHLLRLAVNNMLTP
jgi:hypothetical protein